MSLGYYVADHAGKFDWSVPDTDGRTRHQQPLWTSKEREVIMTRRLISSGSRFEAEIGFSRAVVDGEWVFVSGTTGYDYKTMTISDDVVAQTEQCLRNVEWALQEAGASLRDVVRVRYILPNPDDFPKCWPVLRAAFGDIRPAATMFVAALIERSIKLEIEVTARRTSAR